MRVRQRQPGAGSTSPAAGATGKPDDRSSVSSPGAPCVVTELTENDAVRVASLWNLRKWQLVLSGAFFFFLVSLDILIHEWLVHKGTGTRNANVCVK